MLKDIRFALRQLLKQPGFTVIAVVTVALAIGATTAVLSLVNGLLIRPLPYRDPHRLVVLLQHFKTQNLERIPVSPAEFVDYNTRARSFERLGAFGYTSFNLAGEDRPERISGATVTAGVLPLLGVSPVKGRLFQPEECTLGRDDVVIISARLWQRRFNSDPQIIGTKLLLNGKSFTVVGVMPASFDFPLQLFNLGSGGQFRERAEIWKPLAFTNDEMKARYSRSFWIIGRLAQGTSVPQAQAEVDAISAQMRSEHPNNYTQDNSFGGDVLPLQALAVAGMRPALLILLGAVFLVLLIACANLTTMLLARAASREREMAIRVALGASLKRMLRQLLTESVSLSIMGGTAGILLAFWALDFLRVIGAQTVPRLREVNLDWQVLAMTLAVSVATGILFGLVPALVSARPELTEALKEGGRGSTAGAHRNPLRNSLIVGETVLALVLLIAAGLLVKSFVRLQNVSPGFNPHNVLTAEISLPALKYPRGNPVINFYAEAERRIKNIPGVQQAAFTVVLPLSGSNTDSSFVIEGQNPRITGTFPDEEIRDITPDYFRVLQTPLLQGRFFTEADTAESPQVVIVNEAFAKKYFPSGGALGKRISRDDQEPKWATIVGVVANIRHRGLDVEAQPEYYLPHTQGPDRDMVLAVRSAQDARTLAGAIRDQLRNVDPDIALANVRTLDQVVADSIAPRRLSVLLLAAFSGIALLLASIGMYGVISFLVVQRTHEIGVRMALGAQRSDVLRMVTAHAAKLLLIGAAIGLPIAFLSNSALRTLLYDVSPFDVSIFLFVTAILAGVGLLASYLPALRATKSDPMVVLGHNT